MPTPRRRTVQLGRWQTNRDRLVAAFLLGVVLFTPPIIPVFNIAGRVGGIPVLYLYLFGAWGGLVAILAAIIGQWDRSAPPSGQE